MPSINILPIAALTDNYIWLIINNKEKQAIIVDPGEATPVITYLTKHNITPVAIFITHHHWDHTNGIVELIQHYQVKVFGSDQTQVAAITDHVDDNNIITVNANFPDFKVLAIPGHTLDHIAYYSPDMLFCGDTLFAAGCGRAFEGTHAQLYQSLQKLAGLPNETKIYCAHEYTLKNLQFAQLAEPNNTQVLLRMQNVTELREKNLPSLPSLLIEEKATNPFLRCHSLEALPT